MMTDIWCVCIGRPSSIVVCNVTIFWQGNRMFTSIVAKLSMFSWWVFIVMFINMLCTGQINRLNKIKINGMCVLSIYVIQRGLVKLGLMYNYALFDFYPTAGYYGIVSQHFQAAVIHNVT